MWLMCMLQRARMIGLALLAELAHKKRWEGAMEADDADPDVLACADCAVPIEDPGLERAYLFAEDQALCQVCAKKRGGVYDELDDRWVVAPNMSGLFPDGDPEFGPRGVAP